MYKLNRRVTFKVWNSSTDIYVGPTAVEVASYDKWAQVDNRSGGIDRTQGKDQWQYDTVIIVRHERTRPTKSNMTIDYEGARYRINQVVIENEAHNKWDKCYCSMMDEDIASPGPPETFRIIKETGEVMQSETGNTLIQE